MAIIPTDRSWWGGGWRVCKTGVCVCVFYERAHVRARASPVCGKGCHHPHHFALRWQVTGDKRCWPLLPSSLTSFEAQKHRKSHCGLHSSLTNRFGHLPSSLPACMHSTLLCASVNLVKILPNLKSEIIFAPLAVCSSQTNIPLKHCMEELLPLPDIVMNIVWSGLHLTKNLII